MRCGRECNSGRLDCHRDHAMNALLFVVVFLAYAFLFAAVTGQPISTVVRNSTPTLKTVG